MLLLLLAMQRPSGMVKPQAAAGAPFRHGETAEREQQQELW
jgi:hypothetical protein